MISHTSPLLKGISHVQVPVLNLEKSIIWYTDFLGCLVKENYGTFAILRLNEGPDIFLWETGDETSSTFLVNGESFPTIGIQTNDMASFTAKLRDSKTEIIEIPYDSSIGMKFVKFFDLDGNMFVVHEVVVSSIPKGS